MSNNLKDSNIEFKPLPFTSSDLQVHSQFVSVDKGGGSFTFKPLVESAPKASTPSPKIETIREQDRIKLIRIVCTCGQIFEIECQYD